VKFFPVTVTRCPPLRAPERGDTLDTAGRVVAVAWGVAVVPVVAVGRVVAAEA
jgi:hypothetical protein